VRLAVIGASGWIGGLVTGEALERGHEVTGLLRDSGKAEALPGGAGSAVADVTDAEAVANAIDGHDAIVGAYRAPAEQPEQMPQAARSVCEAAGRSGVTRLIWTGGTGVMRVPGTDTDVVDLPQFPEEWRASTLAHREALQVLRSDGEELDWTYVCPPRTIEPGDRTGEYRTSVDDMLFDENGQSRISAEDFAVAVVDLLESGEHRGERVNFAY
jgi:uncharacterized protein